MTATDKPSNSNDKESLDKPTMENNKKGKKKSSKNIQINAAVIQFTCPSTCKFQCSNILSTNNRNAVNYEFNNLSKVEKKIL